MIDRDKLIGRFEFNIICDSETYNTVEIPIEEATEILKLLKEQEAVAPKRIDGKRNHFTKCGNCNRDLMSGYHYCPHCGKAVKWE